MIYSTYDEATELGLTILTEDATPASETPADVVGRTSRCLAELASTATTWGHAIAGTPHETDLRILIDQLGQLHVELDELSEHLHKAAYPRLSYGGAA